MAIPPNFAKYFNFSIGKPPIDEARNANPPKPPAIPNGVLSAPIPIFPAFPRAPIPILPTFPTAPNPFFPISFILPSFFVIFIFGILNLGVLNLGLLNLNPPLLLLV